MGFYKKVKTDGMSRILDMNSILSYPHKTHWKKFCGVVRAPDQPTNQHPCRPPSPPKKQVQKPNATSGARN